jgi:hypothetical protein
MGELWLVRRLLGRRCALLYVPFLLSVEDIRSGRGKLTSDDYGGAVVALLYQSAAARGVLGLLSAGVFAVLAIVSIGFVTSRCGTSGWTRSLSSSAGPRRWVPLRP